MIGLRSVLIGIVTLPDICTALGQWNNGTVPLSRGFIRVVPLTPEYTHRPQLLWRQAHAWAIHESLTPLCVGSIVKQRRG